MRNLAVSKIVLVPLLVANFVFLTGCQSNDNDESSSSSATPKISSTTTSESQSSGKPNYDALPKPCAAHKSPPIKDKSKIRQLLIKQGKISSDMSEEKIVQIVNEYITKKNQAYKICKTKK